MFSKLIKIISAASLFLVLGVAMTCTIGVSATGNCPGTETQTAPTTCSGGSTPTTTTTTVGARVPSAQQLCSGPCPITSTAPTSAPAIVSLIISIARFLSYISVGIAVIVIIYGGYMYLNPTDPKGAEQGSRILTQAAIGLAVALTAVTIVTILSQILTGSYF